MPEKAVNWTSLEAQKKQKNNIHKEWQDNSALGQTARSPPDMFSSLIILWIRILWFNKFINKLLTSNINKFNKFIPWFNKYSFCQELSQTVFPMISVLDTPSRPHTCFSEYLTEKQVSIIKLCIDMSNAFAPKI